MGRRNMFYATGLPGWARAAYGYPAFGADYMPEFSKEEESAMLKEEAKALQEELKAVEERLSTLERIQSSKASE